MLVKAKISTGKFYPENEWRFVDVEVPDPRVLCETWDHQTRIVVRYNDDPESRTPEIEYLAPDIIVERNSGPDALNQPRWERLDWDSTGSALHFSLKGLAKMLYDRINTITPKDFVIVEESHV